MAVVNPVTGKPFLFGSRAMTAPETAQYGSVRPVSFAAYLPGGVKGVNALLTGATVTLPTPPRQGTYADAPGVQTALAQSYRNNELNDCIIAACAHSLNIVIGNNGTGPPPVYTDAQIGANYQTWCGWDGFTTPGPGCNPIVVLEGMKSTGFTGAGDQIYGYAHVNFQRPQEMRTAIYLFENLFLELELDLEWLLTWNGLPGFKWDIQTPITLSELHAVAITQWQTGYLFIDSWGIQGAITNRAIATYGLGAYVILTKEILNASTHKSKSGYNWSQLVADLGAV